MSVLFCDADGELWYDKIDALGLNLIKMPYMIDGNEYLFDCGREADIKGFYRLLREKKTAITSALNAENYKEYFEPFFKAGEDILYIAFSSQMSGTFAQMDVAVKELSEKYPNARFRKFDTLSISMGAGLQTYLAAKYFREGHTTDEVIDYLTDIREKVFCTFVVDDLDHLKRGGRLSAVAAFAGGILDLKPVLKVSDEGKLYVDKKVRGRKLAINTIINSIKENLEVAKNYPVAVLDADCKEEGDAVADKIREILGNDVEIIRQPVGPVVGAHCGPGTIGVCFVANHRC